MPKRKNSYLKMKASAVKNFQKKCSEPDIKEGPCNGVGVSVDHGNCVQPSTSKSKRLLLTRKNTQSKQASQMRAKNWVEEQLCNTQDHQASRSTLDLREEEELQEAQTDAVTRSAEKVRDCFLNYPKPSTS